MYQALVAMFFIVAAVLVFSSEAGLCARRRSGFLLLRQKKVTKEKAPLLCVTPTLARRGNLRCSVRRCAAELAARCALRSNNCGESVHEVGVSFGTPTHPLPCASRHAQKGTRGADIHPGHRCARPRFERASATRCADRAERSDGPCGCPAVQTPAGCACGGAVAGWHARRSARAS